MSEKKMQLFFKNSSLATPKKYLLFRISNGIHQNPFQFPSVSKICKVK